MEALGKTTAYFGFIGLGFLTSMLWANVLQDLWVWFVVPVFALAPLPFWTAYGILLVGYAFTYSLKRVEPEGEATLFSSLLFKVVHSVIAALTTWGFGALVNGFAA
jgi:hypothetical protein